MPVQISDLKALHYKCRDFLNKKEYHEFIQFLKTFYDPLVDVNELKTILIISKPFLNQAESEAFIDPDTKTELRNTVNYLQYLFDTKMGQPSTKDKTAIEEYKVNIGKLVRKVSHRPFKSALKVNTVMNVIPHPITDNPAYTFKEDDSCVQCISCEVVEGL